MTVLKKFLTARIKMQAENIRARNFTFDEPNFLPKFNVMNIMFSGYTLPAEPVATVKEWREELFKGDELRREFDLNVLRRKLERVSYHPDTLSEDVMRKNMADTEKLLGQTLMLAKRLRRDFPEVYKVVQRSKNRDMSLENRMAGRRSKLEEIKRQLTEEIANYSLQEPSIMPPLDLEKFATDAENALYGEQA